jgi:hypothetical protein
MLQSELDTARMLSETATSQIKDSLRSQSASVQNAVDAAVRETEQSLAAEMEAYAVKAGKEIKDLQRVVSLLENENRCVSRMSVCRVVLCGHRGQ